MQKVKHKLAIYGKMYGHTLPTVEKMENAGAVADIVTVAYNTGVIDAKENINRLADLEKIVTDEYNTPGEFQNWLVDSIKKPTRYLLVDDITFLSVLYYDIDHIYYAFFKRPDNPFARAKRNGEGMLQVMEKTGYGIIPDESR